MGKNTHPKPTLTGVWSPNLLKPFVENLRPSESNTYRTGYRFRIDGLVQQVDEDSYELKGFRETEIERKAYGGKQIETRNSELILPVLVTFRVRRKDEEFPSALGKTVDGIYVNPYYTGWLHFNEYEGDHSSRVPFLDFVIWLLPEEWEAVRESLLIAKVPPVMSV